MPTKLNYGRIMLYLVAFLAAFLICVAMISAGEEAALGEKTAAVCSSAVFAAMLLLAAPDLYCIIKIKRANKRRDVKRAFERREKYKKRVESDLDGAVKRLALRRRTVYFVAAVFAVLCLALSFFAADLPLAFSLVCLAVGVYGLFGLIVIFTRREDRSELRVAVSETEYPRLYALARSARDAMGVSGEVRIVFAGGSDAGITTVGRTFVVSLGDVAVSLLKEPELKAVLLHEFGHAGEDAIALKKYLLYFPEQTESPWLTFESRLVLFWAKFLYYIEHSRFLECASELLERRADERAASACDPADAASALAKTAMSEFFDDAVDAEYEDQTMFESETPPENVRNLIVSAILKCFEERKDEWLDLIKNEKPRYMSSHPTFPQRLAALGNPDFTLELPGGDDPLASERAEMLAYGDREVLNSLKDDYPAVRKKRYLDKLEVINKYESGEIPVTPDKYPQILQAYAAFSARRAEAFCDKHIDRDGNPSAQVSLLFYKGERLLARFDPAGLPMVYTAMETNSNYIESGLDAINRFLVYRGTDEELEKFYAEAPGWIQRVADFHSESDLLSSGARTLSAESEIADLPDIVEKIVGFGGGRISEVFAVHKPADNEAGFVCAIVLVTDGKASKEELHDIYDACFRLLDNRDDDFTLYLDSEEATKIARKVDGSRVYGPDGQR